jgi:murein DD-endopeptidase MepM/ murein hydrolase activator NlpD
MQNPVFPTVQTAYIFQKFANIDWKLYGKTNGQHMGIDIGVASGLPGADIYAVQYGLVVEAGYFDQGGYGRRVVIEHEDKSFSTLYAHLKDMLVKEGDVVSAGQKIGTMGGNLEDKLRGASGGTHLHFEVILPEPVKNSIRTFKGWCVDPIPYLMQRYFLAPINAIRVTSIKGLRVRTQPNVTSFSISALSMHDVINVMGVLPSANGEQWVKLWSLRDEFCAIKYNGLANAEFAMPINPAPQPDPIPDTQNETSANLEQQGYAKAVAEIKTFIEGMSHA